MHLKRRLLAGGYREKEEEMLGERKRSFKWRSFTRERQLQLTQHDAHRSIDSPVFCYSLIQVQLNYSLVSNPRSIIIEFNEIDLKLISFHLKGNAGTLRKNVSGWIMKYSKIFKYDSSYRPAPPRLSRGPSHSAWLFCFFDFFPRMPIFPNYSIYSARRLHPIKDDCNWIKGGGWLRGLPWQRNGKRQSNCYCDVAMGNTWRENIGMWGMRPFGLRGVTWPRCDALICQLEDKRTQRERERGASIHPPHPSLPLRNGNNNNIRNELEMGTDCWNLAKKFARNGVDLNWHSNTNTKILIFKPHLHYFNLNFNKTFLHQNEIEALDYFLVFFWIFLNIIKLLKSYAKVGRNEVNLNRNNSKIIIFKPHLH